MNNVTSLIDKINMREWYKISCIMGAIIIIAKENLLYLGLSLLLIGLGEWCSWKDMTAISEYASMNYQIRKTGAVGLLFFILGIVFTVVFLYNLFPKEINTILNYIYNLIIYIMQIIKK